MNSHQDFSPDIIKYFAPSDKNKYLHQQKRRADQYHNKISRLFIIRVIKEKVEFSKIEKFDQQMLKSSRFSSYLLDLLISEWNIETDKLAKQKWPEYIDYFVPASMERETLKNKVPLKPFLETLLARTQKNTTNFYSPSPENPLLSFYPQETSKLFYRYLANSNVFFSTKSAANSEITLTPIIAKDKFPHVN